MRNMKENSALSKLYVLSDSYYNKGLLCARVRDLTGAAQMLKKSLEINKRNTNARNLLGLVLLERGEPAAALSEWIISRHYEPENNDADRYIEMIQSNPTRLDEMNQAVKKYNMALEALKHGKDDLAMIQLKRVVNSNRKFVKASLLLALLYIKNEEYDKARGPLLSVLKTDTANTTALTYINEIKSVSGMDIAASRKVVKGLGKAEFHKEKESVSRLNFEDKPNVMAWVNWFLGIALGIAVTFVLIVPTIKKNIREEYEKEKLDYASELNVELASIAEKDSEIAVLNYQIEELTAKLKATEVVTYNVEIYDTLFTAINSYIELKKVLPEELEESDITDMAAKLRVVNEDEFSSEEALLILDIMKNEYYPTAAEYTLTAGKASYNAGRYDEALEFLQASYEYNADSDSVLYYLGKVYQAYGDYETAIPYYQRVIDDYPSSSLVYYAKIRIGEMQ